jgi:hypothetical protein
MTNSVKFLVSCLGLIPACEKLKLNLNNVNPNVVLILADDLGYEDISVYSNQGGTNSKYSTNCRFGN